MGQGWLGPVFAYEWLTRARRWQGYALRAVFVLASLAALALSWQVASRGAGRSTSQQLAATGRDFFATFTALQLALVLLAAPAATAGAICLDKARGTLSHVLVTDLGDAEVVLGKLGARLVPVFNLVACALPVAALGSLLGGIDPVALTGSFLIAAGVAVLGCSLALVLSVHASKATEVMIGLFAIWAAWLLALPAYGLVPDIQLAWLMWVQRPGLVWGGRPPFWLEVTNPFWLTMARYRQPGETSLLEPALFLLACLAASGGLVALAVARLRPAYLGRLGRPPGPIKVREEVAQARSWARWGRAPSLDANPVLWREWHRNRSSRWTRAAWSIFAVGSSVISLAIVAWNSIDDARKADSRDVSTWIASQGIFGLLLVAASASTSLADERALGDLDVLLATPISTRSIVFGKWWGGFRRVPWLAFWPGLLAYSLLPPIPDLGQIVLAYSVPVLIVVQGAALASLGLALATWIARAGRAAMWTVAAFVGAVIGWPVAVILLTEAPRVDTWRLRVILLHGSPLVNLTATSRIGLTWGSLWHILPGLIFWVIAYALIAFGLYLATLRTFDGCLGRSPENARRPRPGPDGRPPSAGTA